MARISCCPEKGIAREKRLFAASVLSFCFLLTGAQILTTTITADPPKPVEGQNVTLRPAAGPGASGNYRWYRGEAADSSIILVYFLPPGSGQALGPLHSGRETAGSDCSLHITNVNVNDSGTYSFRMEIPGSTVTGEVDLVVSEPVGEVTIASSPTKVFENNITELTCNARGTDVSYFWLKGNQRLEVGGHISLSNNNQVLTFNTTLRNDSDVYTCFANNSIASNSSTYTLDVLYGPGDPVISPGTSYYAAGSTLTLSCNADSNPPANYAWYFNSQPLQEGDTLQLPNLTFSDTGNYTCTASNTETNLSLSQVLEIWVEEMLSSPILTSSEYLPLEKENVTLECSTSSRPEVTVSWYKDGQPVPTNAVPSGNNRSLTIYNFTRADDGNYTCVAENAVSSATSNPNFITMAYGPDNVKIVQSIKITQGQEQLLALVCSADSNPAAQFRWFVNNSDTGVTDETFPLSLLPSENQGTYTCQAHNTRTNLTASASRNITTSAPSLSSPGGLGGGAIAGIVIGTLAVGLALLGGLLYFLLRIRRQSKETTSAPVPPLPIFYENIPPSGQTRTGVNPGISSDTTSHVYETLQPRGPNIYEEVKRS